MTNTKNIVLALKQVLLCMRKVGYGEITDLIVSGDIVVQRGNWVKSYKVGGRGSVTKLAPGTSDQDKLFLEACASEPVVHFTSIQIKDGEPHSIKVKIANDAA